MRLRDLGIGVFAYADDYKGKFPTRGDNEEKAFLGLSLLAKHQELPASIFINTNTTDTPAEQRFTDDRLVLVDSAGRADRSGHRGRRGNDADHPVALLVQL